MRVNYVTQLYALIIDVHGWNSVGYACHSNSIPMEVYFQMEIRWAIF